MLLPFAALLIAAVTRRRRRRRRAPAGPGAVSTAAVRTGSVTWLALTVGRRRGAGPALDRRSCAGSSTPTSTRRCATPRPGSRQRPEGQPAARRRRGVGRPGQRAGFARDNVIWFYKIDTDGAVQAQSPNGWRDSDYLFDDRVGPDVGSRIARRARRRSTTPRSSPPSATATSRWTCARSTATAPPRRSAPRTPPPPRGPPPVPSSRRTRPCSLGHVPTRPSATAASTRRALIVLGQLAAAAPISVADPAALPGEQESVFRQFDVTPQGGETVRSSTRSSDGLGDDLRAGLGRAAAATASASRSPPSPRRASCPTDHLAGGRPHDPRHPLLTAVAPPRTRHPTGKEPPWPHSTQHRTHRRATAASSTTAPRRRLVTVLALTAATGVALAGVARRRLARARRRGRRLGPRRPPLARHQVGRRDPHLARRRPGRHGPRRRHARPGQPVPGADARHLRRLDDRRRRPRRHEAGHHARTSPSTAASRSRPSPTARTTTSRPASSRTTSPPPTDGQAKVRLFQAATVSKTVSVATTTGTTIADEGLLRQRQRLRRGRRRPLEPRPDRPEGHRHERRRPRRRQHQHAVRARQLDRRPHRRAGRRQRGDGAGPRGRRPDGRRLPRRAPRPRTSPPASGPPSAAGSGPETAEEAR